MNPVQRALNDTNRCQDVVAHRLIFCEFALGMSTQDLIEECFDCRRFLAFCCACTSRRIEKERRSRYFSEEPEKPCHYYKMVFVDGSYLSNGQDGATSGMGIAIGARPWMQWAIPIDDAIDPSSVRTSQRAELLAAIHGLHKMAEYEARHNDEPDVRHSSDKITWVVTSDSEYVVSGMTEWVPNWRRNGWRNPHKKRPKNVDLFQSLDAVVERYEQEHGIQIAFWRVGREFNQLADSLAGFAAGREDMMVDSVLWRSESDSADAY